MSPKYGVENGEDRNDFKERLLRQLAERDEEISILRQSVASPAFFFGTYSNGTEIFKIYQKGTDCTVLSANPHESCPAHGIVVGSKLCCFGIEGNSTGDGGIEWSNGSKWYAPAQIDVESKFAPFYVKLEKGDESLGVYRDVGLDIEIPAAGSDGLKISGIKDGLMKEYNDKRPLHPVKEGDLILEVNGKRGAADVIRNEVKSANVLKILIQPVDPTKEPAKSIALVEDEQVQETVKTEPQVEITKEKASHFSIEGRWSQGGSNAQVYQIIRRNNQLFFEEGDEGAKTTGPLYYDEDDWLVAQLSGSMTGTMRLRPQGRQLVSQFRKNDEEEWSPETKSSIVTDFEIVFKPPKGKDVTVTIGHGPLGMTVDESGAVSGMLVGIGVHAQGVKQGWKIKSIGGASVEDADYMTLMAVLEASQAGFPYRAPIAGCDLTYEEIEALVGESTKAQDEANRDPFFGMIRLDELGLTKADVDPLGWFH